LENPSTVQFQHRILALSTLGHILATWARGSMSKILDTGGARLLNTFAGVAVLQVCLGIATVLYVVPIPLAASHQAGSLTLLTVCVTILYYLRRLPVK
jgi:cytochrome c oxidase assembly protein subunit 15